MNNLLNYATIQFENWYQIFKMITIIGWGLYGYYRLMKIIFNRLDIMISNWKFWKNVHRNMKN